MKIFKKIKIYFIKGFFCFFFMFLAFPLSTFLNTACIYLMSSWVYDHSWLRKPQRHLNCVGKPQLSDTEMFIKSAFQFRLKIASLMRAASVTEIPSHILPIWPRS